MCLSGSQPDAAAFEALVGGMGVVLVAGRLGECGRWTMRFRRRFRVAAEAAEHSQSAGGRQLAYGVAHASRFGLGAAISRQRLELRANVPGEALSRPIVARSLCDVHEELDRLPEKYRLPFAVCYLEGHRATDGSAARVAMNVRSRPARRGRNAADSIGPRRDATAVWQRCWDSATGGRSVARLVQITLQSATTGSPSAVVATLLRESPLRCFPSSEMAAGSSSPQPARGVFTLRSISIHRPTRGRSKTERSTNATHPAVLDPDANRWPRRRFPGTFRQNKTKMPPRRDHGSVCRFSVIMDRSPDGTLVQLRWLAAHREWFAVDWTSPVTRKKRLDHVAFSERTFL